jgi:hypothetical protein
MVVCDVQHTVYLNVLCSVVSYGEFSSATSRKSTLAGKICRRSISNTLNEAENRKEVLQFITKRANLTSSDENMSDYHFCSTAEPILGSRQFPISIA